MEAIKNIIKINEKIFDSFVKKNVIKKGFKNYFSKNIEMPRNNIEFKKITKQLYDVPLTVKCFAYPIDSFSGYKYTCNYRINQDQNIYSRNPIYKLWEKKFGQYDGLKVLLNTCFGELFCGGVAGAHYGQTGCNIETWERIKRFNTDNDKLVRDNAEE